MNAVEYALGLIGVVLGLGLADMALSIHRLVHHTRSVKWSWRAALMAVTVFLTIFLAWFIAWFGARDQFVGTNATVLSFTVVGFLIFLMAAASLPDSPKGDFDLEAFYWQRARFVWLILLVLLAMHLVGLGIRASRIAMTAFELAMIVPLVVLPAMVTAALVIWPRARPLHGILVPLNAAWALSYVLLLASAPN